MLRPKNNRTLTNRRCEEVYDACHIAGLEAATNAEPEPFEIYDAHADGSPVENGKSYIVPGLCGFAWVNIKPGNCKFAKWMLENRHSWKDSCSGGVSYWIYDFGQLYVKKSAYAQAFTRTLLEHGAGVRLATAYSRLD